MSRRLFLTIAALLAGLSACAAREPDDTTREIRALRDEIRSLRTDREQDRRRLETLEAHVGALSRKLSAPVSRDVEPSGALRPPADLEVVRLAPEESAGDDGSIFIVDRGSGRPPAYSGGPAGGVDVAPPLATDVALRDPGPAAPAPAPAIEYEAGVAALAEGKVAEAAGLLERFVQKEPRHGAADNALVALGDAYARGGQPGRALKTWERVVGEYPAGDSVATALLRYAAVCNELGRRPAARAALERVVEDFPGTDAAERARVELAGH